MYTLTNTLTRKHPKATATKIEKLLRRSVERRPRVSTRRLPAKKLRQLGRRFTSSAVEELFMCTVCTSALHTPVTLECGHTFCRSCLPERTSTAVCPECGRSVLTESLKCNVLVQDILARLAGDDGKLSRYMYNACSVCSPHYTWVSWVADSSIHMYVICIHLVNN